MEMPYLSAGFIPESTQWIKTKFGIGWSTLKIFERF
jgi:hypothetical protein